MLGRRRRITRSKTDIKAQAGGMVGPYNTRVNPAGFGFTRRVGASWQA